MVTLRVRHVVCEVARLVSLEHSTKTTEKQREINGISTDLNGTPMYLQGDQYDHVVCELAIL